MGGNLLQGESKKKMGGNFPGGNLFGWEFSGFRIIHLFQLPKVDFHMSDEFGAYFAALISIYIF